MIPNIFFFTHRNQNQNFSIPPHVPTRRKVDNFWILFGRKWVQNAVAFVQMRISSVLFHLRKFFLKSDNFFSDFSAKVSLGCSGEGLEYKKGLSQKGDNLYILLWIMAILLIWNNTLCCLYHCFGIFIFIFICIFPLFWNLLFIILQYFLY